MTTPKTAIIFDFGNVLVDWNPRHLYRKLFPGDEAGMERFLAEVDFLGHARQYDLGRPPAEIVAEYSGRFPQYASLFEAYHDRFPEAIGGLIQKNVDLLSELKRLGYPLYGLSNWSGPQFLPFRNKTVFFDLFDDILISGDIKIVKPDPRIYENLLARIGRQPRDCIFVDDSLPNVEAAAKLGFRAIQYHSGVDLRDEMSKMGIL
jgi:2-haloacid dehalogenase